MEQITMVKYTAKQIDQVLAVLTSVAGDSKAYDCSLSMMSVVLDLNSYLRDHAVIFDEPAETKNDKMNNSFENEAVGVDEVVLTAGGSDE